MKPLYFDYNATAPIDPEVAQALADCYAAHLANPASPHRAGVRARRMLDESREQIGRLLGAQVAVAPSDRVVLTSGGTEANNLAIFGLVREQPGHVLISAIEHPSIVGPAEELARRGWQVERIPVSIDGVVLVDRAAEMIRDDTQLVSVMLANNETGAIQPVAELAALCQARGVPMHTDAVQATGKLDVDFQALGVAAMTVSAHKLGGPVGSGALVVRRGANVRPHLLGGAQQLGARPGTESVAMAVGLHAALELWQCDRAEIVARLADLRNEFERRLCAAAPELTINSQRAPRVPHTSNVSFVGVDREAMLMALDLAGIACSTGSACASGSTEPSPVLLAMGLDNRLISSALRFSFGRATTRLDVEEGVDRILAIYMNLRSKEKPSKMASAGRQPTA